VIVETTSGTFGLALAMLCNQQGYRLILVSDPAIDESFQRRLEGLGASVEIVREPAPVGGFQRARLDRLAEFRLAYPDHFWPSQYDNDDNPGGYAALTDFLVEMLGPIDCLVGTVGSGGSMCGTSRYLRLLYPHLYVIGVDTLGSVLFGQPDRKRLLRGLGNSLMPKNVDHTAFDEVHWVSAAEGFLATRELYRRHALYMGPTSGTAYLVARWWAQQHPDASVVVLLPDEGYRYQETVYNDAWLRANNCWLGLLPAAPRQVAHPHEAGPGWSRFAWGRRSYEQILGAPFRAGVSS
jgi:cysteine synthase A